MSTLLTLLTSSPSLVLPAGPVAWAGLAILLALLVYLQWRWRGYNKPWKRSDWLWFALLALATPLTSLFLGLRLPPGAALSPPDMPLDLPGPTAMVLSTVPWMLAAGLLGPLPAALLGLLSGVLQTAWNSHSLFTPLVLALGATLFSALVRQRYRTPIYRLLSHPLAAALFLALLYPLIDLMTALLSTQGELAIRLDYAISNLGAATLAAGIELLVGGLVAEVVALTAPAAWRGDEPLVPAPEERSLGTRFIYSLAPLAFALVLALLTGNWIVAGEAASGMLEARMRDAAILAAENVPYFLNTGQSLITVLARDPTMLSDDPDDIAERLEEYARTVTFFDQLVLLDRQSQVIASHPDSNQAGEDAPVEEQIGFQLALQGVPFQTSTVDPPPGQETAQTSFMASIQQDGRVERVLVGRSILGNNPLVTPIRSSLESAAGQGGEGMLLDENNRILMHTGNARVMSTYTGPSAQEAIFDDQYTAPDGTRRLVYYLPAIGNPWAVVLMVPASQAQQLALDIAEPLFWVILALSLISVFLLRMRLSVITTSLQSLAQEAGRIAQGRLDHPMPVDGEDEVGQLRRDFERMRISLKARLDELNRLLVVSQGVASSLEMSEAVQPVLESALATGASAARVVITPTVVPELNGAATTPVSFGLGPSHNLYRGLDDQILAFTRQQDRLVLSNLMRPRLLNLPPGAPSPASLMAVALRHENLYYGTLWTAYDEPHNFTEEEVRFIVTLGGQAALAAANARLFLTAEIGRQRLAAILASSPDPILVIDQRDHLLVANPAAWQALGLGMDIDEGKTIDELIDQEDLLDLLRSLSDEKQSKEMILPDGRVYLAATTPVLAEGQRVGRVCIMQDVTHFKQLDLLKSEFVSTVSHDLRSPLTLMRGYATMLEMVGQLNEQQNNYVRKIVAGVESMSRLVNNLLDLGRIEAGIGLQLEMTPVHDVIERVVGALQLQAAQKRIQVTIEIPKHTIPLIEADQALLQQALHNLVENAIKYTEPEGKVVVRVRAETGGMVFEVQDTGIGISPMDQQRLFEKFYRGAGLGATEQRGTGLGLAIVKSIAERHGGRVWAESQLGKGSTFYLSVPLRQPRGELNPESIH
jgi:PAS domain S-box-containing protein